MPTFVPREHVVRRAPLGLRFVDLTLGAAVTDGLEVTAAPLGALDRSRPALRSPISGIYGFADLPGLEAYSRGERPASDWCPPAASSVNGADANFVVRVRDRIGRFLSQTLALCLPRGSLLEAPLFSAPTRPAPVGLAVVRGLLMDSGGGPPPAWALLTFSTDPATTYPAVADARGDFVAFLPYAEALPALVGSPPHGPGGQLAWPLTTRAFYAATAQHPVPGLAPDAPPDVRSILAQPPALLEDAPGQPGPTLVRLLQFGEKLHVATAGQTELLLRPA
jgi:hypothetical protein